MPIKFLRQLIGFYGDSLQSVVPNYLEYSMNAFTQNEETMRGYVKEAMGGIFPYSQWEEMGKQNMAMFERAMQMFTPFAANGGTEQPGAKRPEPAGREASDPASDDMSALREQLKALQEQVDNLSRSKDPSGRTDDG